MFLLLKKLCLHSEFQEDWCIQSNGSQLPDSKRKKKSSISSIKLYPRGLLYYSICNVHKGKHLVANKIVSVAWVGIFMESEMLMKSVLFMKNKHVHAHSTFPEDCLYENYTPFMKIICSWRILFSWQLDFSCKVMMMLRQCEIKRLN